MEYIANVYFGKPVGDVDAAPEVTAHALVLKPDPNAVHAVPGTRLTFTRGKGLQRAAGEPDGGAPPQD